MAFNGHIYGSVVLAILFSTDMDGFTYRSFKKNNDTVIAAILLNKKKKKIVSLFPFQMIFNFDVSSLYRFFRFQHQSFSQR